MYRPRLLIGRVHESIPARKKHNGWPKREILALIVYTHYFKILRTYIWRLSRHLLIVWTGAFGSPRLRPPYRAKFVTAIGLLAVLCYT
jgi:hypothetical protein